MMFLAAPAADRANVRKRWLQLTEFVCGLSASVIALPLIADVVAFFAAWATIECAVDHCASPQNFLLVAFSVAIAITALLVVALEPLATDEDLKPPAEVSDS